MAVLEVAVLTMHEMVRRRFVLAACLAMGLLVLLTGWGFHVLATMHRNGQPLSPLELKSATSVLLILIFDVFTMLMAVAALFVAAPTFANDLESGVLLPILTRPIARAEVVVGKALGAAVVVCAYAVLAGLAEFSMVDATTGYFPPHPARAVAYLCVIGIVMVVFGGLLATRLSAIASGIVGIVCFGIVRIGGVAGSLGAAFHNQTVTNMGTVSQLLLPADAMWRAAVFALEPASFVARLNAQGGWSGGPFAVPAPPPPAMLLWTCGWIVAVALLAIWSFATRDL